MELKSESQRFICDKNGRSNRTFMELKLYNNASFFDLFTF